MSEDRSYHNLPNGDAREHFSVTANAFTKFYLIESKVCYRGALPDPEGIRHVLPPDADAEQLGTAILDALSHARFIHPSHPDFDALFKERKAAELVDAYDAELMRLAGVKTKASLYRGARGVNVTLHSDWDEIKIYAFARRKGRYFWSKKTDASGKETVPASASAIELGEAYLRALAKGGSVS
ncbi:contact-dependent growth inhibition system immunity protein [Sulfitobacter porphyrae]|jgi:hypothetical protein|uniref:Contact-dependent growth inhibition system immunity protein n=1 Tax=Sulfitobacter porphyrae TaxID=1246864 RepID=A0ABW2B431_9RHOB|nr:contact-dependent growth inhibition system immunity protein [Sulfitobacter sp. G21635-S1]MCZ4259184.1 contact-dependent growth inhibition system immunity protein [Sulfitobacter sp. G21635-S1]GLT07872.1 hypothetical protein GCM10007928_01030 [Sulfitobacter porphyrae]